MPRGGKRPGAGRKPGVPNKASNEGRELAQTWGKAAIKRAAHLAGLVTAVVPNALGDGEVEIPIGMAKNENVQATCLGMIMDRAYGKATQPIAGDEDMPAILAALKVTYVQPKPDPKKPPAK